MKVLINFITKSLVEKEIRIGIGALRRIRGLKRVRV